MSQNHTKDPSAVLDYTVDYAGKTNGTGPKDWLAPGDTIFTSVWIPAAGIVIEAVAPRAPSKTDTSTTVWLSGGTLYATYALTNHIVTAAGREDDRTIFVYIGDK